MNFSIHQASHIGDRRYNQDRVAYAYGKQALLLVLADGMGGHLHGELAATLAIDTFVDSFERIAQQHIPDPDRFLSETMRIAHERIMSVPHDSNMGGFPGTTCVAALIQDDKIYWGHAGDSRFYLIRNGDVVVRTRDHSIVQQWLEQGLISAEQARIHPQRNQITSCLGGIADAFHMERGIPVALQPGDVLFVSSDGLWGAFTEQELVDSFAVRPVEDVLVELVGEAMKRMSGHSDNVTGLAVRWGGSEPPHDTVKPVCHVLEII